MSMLKIIQSHLSVDYLNKYKNGDTFIETGTYLGDTVFIALEAKFDKIYSIEINQQLFNMATVLFNNKPNVKILHGDCIDKLEELLKTTKGPATYWLDAHASGPLPGGKSGGSPVLDELNIIKKYGHPDSTIFIDDRRLFGSAEWSFVKEKDAIDIIKSINPNYKILFLDGHIEQDIICATIV